MEFAQHIHGLKSINPYDDFDDPLSKSPNLNTNSFIYSALLTVKTISMLCLSV